MTPSITSDNCADLTRWFEKNQLRTLLDALPVLIAYVDARQCYCFSNLAHQSWFGYAPQQIAGMSLLQVLGDEAYAVLRPFIEQALHGEQVKFELLVPYGRLGPRTICATYVPDRNEAGEIKGFFSLISDISELRQIDEKRSRRLQETTHTERLNLMGELTGQIVHQVSQPLSAIVNYAEACSRLVISGDCAPRELADILGDIATEAERAGEIIRRIRGFVSKHEAQLRITDIDALVRESLQLVELDPKWQTVQFRLESEINQPWAQVDPVMIEQVILNLVRNALEAMEGLPREQRQLCLRIQGYADRYLEVSVVDRGAGLHPQARKHLFEPFSSTKKNGMGMGLAISRSIVRRHGGRLWATDNPFGGTTFRFTLPLHHESRSQKSA
ncbi:MAG: ATP-binding protein [Chromatiales bacterium]